MTKWFAWFRENDKIPHFMLIAAMDIQTAEMMAYDIASRESIQLIGVVGASSLMQESEV